MKMGKGVAIDLNSSRDRLVGHPCYILHIIQTLKTHNIIIYKRNSFYNYTV
jgi:hypothetical protein